MGKNMIVVRDIKKFCFNFDWPKYVDENSKHEIKFIIKSNDSLAENKTKKRDWTSIVKRYKHGKNIPEHGKQQNERAL